MAWLVSSDKFYHHMVFIKICTFMFINISPSDGIMIDKKVNGGKYMCGPVYVYGLWSDIWVFIAQSSWSVIIGV